MSARDPAAAPQYCATHTRHRTPSQRRADVTSVCRSLPPPFPRGLPNQSPVAITTAAAGLSGQRSGLCSAESTSTAEADRAGSYGAAKGAETSSNGGLAHAAVVDGSWWGPVSQRWPETGVLSALVCFAVYVVPVFVVFPLVQAPVKYFRSFCRHATD